MTTYDYRLVPKPTEEVLNELGTQGYRVVRTGTDGRDGSLSYALLERVLEAVDSASVEPHTRSGKRQ